MDDYTSSSGRKVEELTREQLRTSRAQTALRLENMLEHAKADASRLGAHLAESFAMNGTSRKHNKDFVKKLENMLQKGCGFGLSTFVPEQRLQALQTDEERMYCHQPLQDRTSERRSVIAYSGEDADRPRKIFEAPRL